MSEWQRILNEAIERHRQDGDSPKALFTLNDEHRSIDRRRAHETRVLAVQAMIRRMDEGY